MSRTLSIRVEDSLYRRLKAAAEAVHRPISNFIEHATLSYLESSSFVDDAEMEDILGDRPLVKDLKEALADVKNGNYRIVRPV